MGKRDRTRLKNVTDPEERRYYQQFPKLPSLDECLALIEGPKKLHGYWIDLLIYDLADIAPDCLDDMISRFWREFELHNETSFVALCILMAIDESPFPGATDFLADVLQRGDDRASRYAASALKTINTPASRKALFEAEHDRDKWKT